MIRFMYGDGDLCTQKQLADSLNLSVSTIRRVVTSPPESSDPPTSLSVRQVAELLNVSTGHVYDLAREGVISCRRHGRLIRITREQFDQYLRDAERQKIKKTGFRHF